MNCNTKYWFKCNTCDHSFDSELANINFGKWCPYCSNPPKQLCNDSNCITCFNKSFACHKKAFFWDSAKNKCSARDCFLNSECKYWFVCEFCQHSFEASLTRVSYNGWCPYCSNPPKKLCNNSTCTLCFKKSFAMSIKAKFWNDLKNKSITPRQVFLHCNSKYWFICEKGHDFLMKLCSISKNHWCHYCVNKTEQKMYNTLSIHFPSLQREYKPYWSQNKRYDFLIPEMNTIIELDGRQHFVQVKIGNHLTVLNQMTYKK